VSIFDALMEKKTKIWPRKSCGTGSKTIMHERAYNTHWHTHRHGAACGNPIMRRVAIAQGVQPLQLSLDPHPRFIRVLHRRGFHRFKTTLIVFGKSGCRVAVDVGQGFASGADFDFALELGHVDFRFEDVEELALYHPRTGRIGEVFLAARALMQRRQNEDRVGCLRGFQVRAITGLGRLGVFWGLTAKRFGAGLAVFYSRRCWAVCCCSSCSVQADAPAPQSEHEERYSPPRPCEEPPQEPVSVLPKSP
jgi:hypothetical protein